jgi:pimeloyl-ACP methyl ester carboxylesterase
MKSNKLTMVLLFLVTYSWMSYGQEINYGSNHGKYISLSNTNIYYEEYGTGMPLLLFHGGFGSIHDFQQVIPEFAKHFKVIAVDSPGHGRSEQADSLSFDLMTDYFSNMIDQFKLDSVYIIGYSDGGITALLLAAKRPDKVKKIIASGVNSRMDGVNTEVLEYLKLINPAFIETSQKEWLADYKSKSPEKDKWKKYITDITRMYSKDVLITDQILSIISAEVLLVFGDRDVIKLEHGIELYRKIAGSKFCVLPNTPHEVFSVSPKVISNIGIEFLTK